MKKYIIEVKKDDRKALLCGLRNVNDGIEAVLVKNPDMAITFKSFRLAEQMINVIIELKALSFSDADIKVVELIKSVD